ncbi:MAG: penicillin-binding protein 1C [Maritimibacter sp.]
MSRRNGLWALWIAVVFLWGAALARDTFDDWVNATELPSLSVATGTEVVDRNGQLLRAYTVADGRWRMAWPSDQIDPLLVDMLVAYEDKRFWTHAGIDPIAVLRAATQALWAGHVVSGASTLTMQTARLLEDGPTGTARGKLRQMRVALALERHLSKHDILALYLARAPYGGNVEGVRAATRIWFGKDPTRLTPSEAALLVALPQSPEHRRPDRHPEEARRARDRVISRIEAQGRIAPSLAATARHDPVPRIRRQMPVHAAHLADRLKANHASKQIQTTVDAGLQSKLETLAARAIADHGGGALSVAILVADHHTGEVLASVGSGGYAPDVAQGFVDMTNAARSPGSTLKPLVYGLAFDAGIAHPLTTIDDRPMRFGTYAPENFDGEYRGPLPLREALIQSLNIPVVALTAEIGPANLMAGLRRAGVNAQLPGGSAPGLAVALGGVGITPWDLTALYAGIANLGRSVALRVEPDQPVPVAARIMSPNAAWHISNILSDMPAPPTARRLGIAYKTGTSYGHRDTWAVGFDGRHVVTIWMGRPDGTPVPGAFGAKVAAPVLFEAFGRLKSHIDPLPNPPPGTVLLSHDLLPPHLQRFGFTALQKSRPPELAFPPNGAIVELGAGPLAVKIRDGLPPFTVLANGAPVVVAVRGRDQLLRLGGPGHVTLSVIDATGQAARAQVELR